MAKAYLMRYCRVVALLWLVWGSGAAWAENRVWEPEKTRAVIVGVLKWQNPEIGTFPVENRQDRKLHQTLLARGVPKDQISLLLDEKATRQAVLDAMQEQLSSLRPGETFLFYYAGHGVRDKDRRVVFLPYDYTRTNALSTQDLQERLLASKAQRVLLFADCCHSGALEEVALALESTGVEAASLTSATAELTSTSNWTFTQTLIDCLTGTPAADRDGNLSVTFSEAASEVQDAMRFYEHQQSGAFFREPLDHFSLAKAPASPRQLSAPYALYDYAMIEYDEKKGIGRVKGTENGNLVLELQAYSQRVPLEVPVEHLRPLPTTPTRVDDAHALELAAVDGKYSQLLTAIEVEPDYLEYSSFHDHGYYPACNYRGYTAIPAGHWVYVYPRWYIWGERSEAAK